MKYYGLIYICLVSGFCLGESDDFERGMHAGSELFMQGFHEGLGVCQMLHDDSKKAQISKDSSSQKANFNLGYVDPGLDCEKVTHFIYVPKDSPQMSCIEIHKNKEFKIIGSVFVDNVNRVKIGYCIRNYDRVWKEVFYPCGVKD